MRRFFSRIALGISVLFGLATLTTSIWQPLAPEDAYHSTVRPYEFDFASWTLKALAGKIRLLAAGFEHYLIDAQERVIIRDYFTMVSDTRELENAVESILADPSIEDPQLASLEIRAELAQKHAELEKQSWLAEMVIQKQVSSALADLRITRLGQAIPPVFYHGTNLPKELIISRRDKIYLLESISLTADIEPGAIVALENKIESITDFSALVVSVGGVGTYPSMVTNTTSLDYLADTVAHEWIHNHLFFRPLGMRYSQSPELRTINETTATISGEEIGQTVLNLYYRDLLGPIQPAFFTYEANTRTFSKSQEDEPIFNFNQEMYQTRSRVDELLSQGKIQAAEEYMEGRRMLFWENGHKIRKLNQAYFAFHGAYADEPYSAAGEDPVGAAVRLLRLQSSSLAEFLRRMSGITSPDQLYTQVYAY